eukprot:m.250963 g.250963  ORF g.250963 m.250963 type:complete len:242 (+) comp17516_c1_seq68:2459-3184(+)
MMALPTKKAKHIEFEPLVALQQQFEQMPIAYFQTNGLPRLLYQHQLYSIAPSRTIVDRAVASACQEGKIVRVPLGGSNMDTVVLLKQDYISHVESKMALLDKSASDYSLLERFQTFLLQSVSCSFQRESLQADGFSVSELQRLVQLGYLSNRNEHTMALAVPSLGCFTRDMTQGRDTLLKSMKRKKFKEVLESELRTKKLKGMRLSVAYHVSDLAGLDCISVMQTSSGRMLRLKTEVKKRR